MLLTLVPGCRTSWPNPPKSSTHPSQQIISPLFSIEIAFGSFAKFLSCCFIVAKACGSNSRIILCKPVFKICTSFLWPASGVGRVSHHFVCYCFLFCVLFFLFFFVLVLVFSWSKITYFVYLLLRHNIKYFELSKQHKYNVG
jgi:hypothetical protein